MGDLGSCGDVLGAMLDGERHAVCVRGLVDPVLTGDLVAAMRDVELAEHPFSVRFEAYSRGIILDHSERDLDDYLREGDALERAVRGCAAGRAILATLDEALSQLHGGGIVEVPRSTGGAAYAAFTVRRYPTGGLIPPHCEREQLGKPSYGELAPSLDGATLLSFLLVLASPRAGGRLVLYELGPDDDGADRVLRERMQVAQKLAGVSHVEVDLREGDLIVFDGGRRYHQILPVEGPVDRWTLGGFIGRSAHDGRVLRWS